MKYSGFYLDKEVGNNALGFDNRTNKQLWIPELIEIKKLSEIQLQDDKDKIAFEDLDFNDKLSSNYGLKNFYEIKNNLGKKIYLFDNHNHAYYFWYKAKFEGLVGEGVNLIHIDEHADTRDPGEYLLKPESLDLSNIFYYTNFVYNVGNYIIPAEKEGLIKQTIQIRNSTNLENYLSLKDNLRGDNILNLDLDFFQPDLDFIDYNKKKEVVVDAFRRSKIITIATSPFFINQKLALDTFKDIFSEIL